MRRGVEVGVTRTEAGRARKVRVLVVDDSAFARKLMSDIIDAAQDMTVVGTAAGAQAAHAMIRDCAPDVVTLDVEMPGINGLDFLEQLLRVRPIPVVMVSTLTARGSDITLRALELGAVEYVLKPGGVTTQGLRDFARELTEKIRVAMQARLRPRASPVAPAAPVPPLKNRHLSGEKLIVIGASTGGTEAIREVLTRLPPDAPGVLVTQHMPEAFTRSFAARLDGLCRISVSEAQHGERVLPGHAYIAPGHSHLLLRENGGHYAVELSQGPAVNRHRPSVDVLFRSVARVAGGNAVGIMLTGMGKDGAAGMLEMMQAGSHNIAQDEASCVVFGMPREAIATGGVHEVLPLREIAAGALARLAAMSRGRPVTDVAGGAQASA